MPNRSERGREANLFDLSGHCALLRLCVRSRRPSSPPDSSGWSRNLGSGILPSVTLGTHDIDHDAAVRGLAEVAGAAATSRDSQAVLDLLVARVRVLLHARACFVILVGTDQRVRVTASSGLVTRFREVWPQHDRDGLAMTAMADRRTIVSEDVLNDSVIALSPSSRGFIEREGYRAGFAVPLLTDTRVLGVLMTGRAQVGAFSPQQIELAEAFAHLATVALESARLSSVDAARTRVDEVFIELERELVGELSIDRLLPLIVEHARRLVDAHGSIYLAEPQRRWLRQAWTSWPETLSGVAFGVGLVGTCAESRRGHLVSDYPSWPHAYPAAVAMGMRHLMAQPLLSRGQLLGVIAMGRNDPEAPFEPRDLALLQRFATQAALALRNATLYGEAEQRRRAAEALAEMARALSETPDVDVLGAHVVRAVGSLFGLACTVRLLEPDGTLVAIASTDVTIGHVQAAGTGLTARVLAGGQAATTSDLTAEPDLALDDDLRRRAAHRGVAVVPLRAEQRIIGVLQIIAPQARTFSPLELELAQTFADQAAPVLEGARLHADLRTSEERTRLIIDTALDAV